MQGEAGLIFPRNCQAYCMYTCQLGSPMLFRTGLLVSHQFIWSDLLLDIRYRPLNSLENCTSFCCSEVLGDCRDKGQLSSVLLSIACTECCLRSFFGVGIGDYVRAPNSEHEHKGICKGTLSIMLSPCDVHSYAQVHFTNSLVLSIPVDFRGEDAGGSVFA